MRLLLGLPVPGLLNDLCDGFDVDRVDDLSDGFDVDRVEVPSGGLDDVFEEVRAGDFESGLNSRFSSSSWNFLPISLAVLWDLAGEFFFLMNFVKSPCFLDFPPGIRGFSESFINFINCAQR